MKKFMKKMPLIFAALALCALAASCKKADVNEVFEVAKNNDAKKMQQLIKRGTDVNAKNNDGMTALMLVAENFPAVFEKAVNALIVAWADGDAENDYDRTVPMYTEQENATDTAKVLIAAGADVNAKNNDGKTALMIAEEYDAADVIALLNAAGA